MLNPVYQPISIVILAIVSLGSAPGACAQTAPLSQARMGHLHLNVQDIEANKKFWAAMGGTPMQLGNAVIEGVKFGDVQILLRKNDSPAPAIGSVINHFGLTVPNVQDALAKWKAAGLKTETGRNAQQGFVYSPGDLVRVEILEDPKQTVPVAFHHVHFFVPDSPAGGVAQMQAWYAKMFGATPGKRLNFDTANLPGAELTFTKSDMPAVASKGRGVDHVGFRIKGLKAYCKMLESSGMKLDTAYTERPDLGLALAFITDPWGTSIELNDDIPAH
jgi:catechol 2,3-dioxygenase-like lactoylglutathione lyase family enzyme